MAASEEIPRPISRRSDVQRIFDHLDRLASGLAPPAPGEDPATFIEQVRDLNVRYAAIGEPPAIGNVRETRAAGPVPADWVYTDGGDPDRRLVYIHGGGWCAGSPASYRWIARALAHWSGAAVLLVNYRLAPEHPFPAGLDDCVAAIEFARNCGPVGERPASQLWLAGDSAGGNLAAAACLQLIEANQQLPDRLALIAPVVSIDTDAGAVGRDDPICRPDALASSLQLYAPGLDPRAEPLLAPVYADPAALGRFPPTLIQASSSETLLADAKALTGALEAADVRVVLSIWPGLPHVWHLFAGVLPEAGEAVMEIARFLTPATA